MNTKAPQYPIGKDILIAGLKSETFWNEMEFKGQDSELILTFEPCDKIYLKVRYVNVDKLQSKLPAILKIVNAPLFGSKNYVVFS